MLRGLLVLLVGFVAANPKDGIMLECETTVPVGDGKLVIELWPWAAPTGVGRIVDMAKSGFFEDLPFFRAIAGFLIQFGISTDAAKQSTFNQKGNIKDDFPNPAVPFTDGIISFAGYGKDSRSTHLFLTLGNQPNLGRSPWEVPVGKVITGLDVMHGIYTGYGDKVNQNQLQPSNAGAKAYLDQFPKLDRFKSCTVKGDGEHRVEL